MSAPGPGVKSEKTLVYQVQDDILALSKLSKLSHRSDPSYFTGRAGIIRIVNLLLAILSIVMMTPGYHEVNLWDHVLYNSGDIRHTVDPHHHLEGSGHSQNVNMTGTPPPPGVGTGTDKDSVDRNDPNVNEDLLDIIRKMKTNGTFSGYKRTYFTIASIGFGACTLLISGTFVALLYWFMEVRCELAWERVNQRAHVLACVLSVAAAFCDVMSIQKIQEQNCGTLRCREEIYNTKNFKYEEPFYPPFFLYHYIAFVGFLANAMCFSIASRIWLRNED